jgi:hypothetical protein
MQKIWIFFLVICAQITANPFKIDFPVKEQLTDEDYIEVQQKLQTLDIRPIFEEFYPEKAPRKIVLKP